MLCMSTRVNISIPDELHNRLQAVKEQVNVSAVCAAALTSAVQVQEALNQAQGGKEKMIERLRAEREELENEWFQAGKVEGIESAENTSYADFTLIAEVYNSGDQFWVENLSSRDEFEWMIEKADAMEIPENLRQDFYRGILDALLAQWLAVEDEVMA